MKMVDGIFRATFPIIAGIAHTLDEIIQDLPSRHPIIPDNPHDKNYAISAKNQGTLLKIVILQPPLLLQIKQNFL
mgnify:CR=1 FL=1